MNARPERNDSLTWRLLVVFVLLAAVPAVMLAVQLAAHDVPLVWVVFGSLASWTGLYMSLGHVYEVAQLIAARRARQGGGR
jgi:uncharacterized membrane protein YjjB (DUF3815 family)